MLTGIGGISGAPPQVQGSMVPITDTRPIKANLDWDKKQEMKVAEEELVALEDAYPGIASHLFPTVAGGQSDVEQCADERMRIKKKYLEPFVTNPLMAMSGLTAYISDIMNEKPERGIEASLVGPPKYKIGKYTPIWPLIVKKAATKEFTMLASGQDSIQFTDPLGTKAAFVWNPAAFPLGKEIQLTGANTTVLPFFISTNYYSLSIMDWARFLIKPIVEKKLQLQQELDMGIDDQVLAATDAALPNDTLYSSHATHIVTDISTQINLTNFKTAGRLLYHPLVHEAPPGIALMDIAAIWQYADMGTDVWTSQTVEDFNKLGFGVQVGSNLVAGMKTLEGYSVIRNPRNAAGALNVRFFSTPDNVGWYVPVTFNGQEVYVNSIPMSGQDPNWSAISNAMTPPGFQFNIYAWRSLAIVIDGYYNISKLAQT